MFLKLIKFGTALGNLNTLNIQQWQISFNAANEGKNYHTININIVGCLFAISKILGIINVADVSNADGM